MTTMMTSSSRHPASFRDPSGFLFHQDGLLLRQVNRSYQEHYDHLMESGLYTALVEKGLLVTHEEVDAPFGAGETGYKVIQPEPLGFISYPYEWSFTQLKHAALQTLRIQRLALKHGMTLKDSSAYNIQFRAGKPILIDTLSFEIYQEGQPWVAYRQFCQHFLAPLALMAHCDIRLGQLLRTQIDGVALDLASRLLPARTKLNFPLLSHIHLHAAAQNRLAGRTIEAPAEGGRGMGRQALLGLLDSLKRATRKLEWKPTGTAWGEYYDFHNYSEAAIEHKKQLVADYLEIIQPQQLWDLGANTGLFSRIATEMQIPTIAFDIDPAAVETNFRISVEQGDAYMLPLLQDLTNPSPALGWAHEERQSLIQRGSADAVMALALIHHLAITNNVPLDSLARFFDVISPWLIMEFVPKSDSQVQQLLASREDIFDTYTEETFRQAFEGYFDLQKAEGIQGTGRVLYLWKRRNK